MQQQKGAACVDIRRVLEIIVDSGFNVHAIIGKFK